MDLIEVGSNENRHPWELSRTACILHELEKLGLHGNVLDIGCGDGFFDRQLAKARPDLRIFGVDINLPEESQEGNVCFVSSPEHLPEIQFDCILMMDVLEHMRDDGAYLKNIVKRLKKRGTVLITVPAFMSLYSLHDKELRHYRRYNHRQLAALYAQAGLREVRWSYFYLSLIVARLLTWHSTQNLSGWQHPEHDLRTKAVTFVLNADFAVLRALSACGLHLPGLSLLSVCKRRSSK